MANTTPNELYIGLMSGTSIDGIDAALFNFNPGTEASGIEMLACHHSKFDDATKSKILTLSQPGANEIDNMGELDVALGRMFAKTVQELLSHTEYTPGDITAIGSHGQTIRHRPSSNLPFSLQIGDPNTIAQHTGITTIADFRRRDMAAGGQGAPLAPAFHQAFFANPSEIRCVVNIGGMANISILDNKPDQTAGYDTGPGNVLMDAWAAKHLGQEYDTDGGWAQSGTVHTPLLEQLLSHPYFALQPPKSTGREDFHISWLEKELKKFSNLTNEDIQATLCELTAHSIAHACNHHKANQVYVCGGGAHNTYLLSRIKSHLEHTNLSTTDTLKIPPDWVEAALFAWLAKQTLSHQKTVLANITGASTDVILGGIYLGNG